MSAYILGIDLGTGSTKAVAVDSDGQVVGSAQFYYPTDHPEIGYMEQDPELIWDAFKNCISQIVKELQGQPTAISFSSAMHSLIAVDELGVKLANMMTWADSRSEDIATALRASSFAEQLYQTSGTPLFGMSPLCKIMWLKKNQPELFNNAYKFIGIKEYIWYRLFHVFEIDYSIASATGLFDINLLEWNPIALDLAAVTKDQLSVVVNTSHCRREVDPAIAQKIGLKADTAFIVGASDGCLANLGSLAIQDGIAALSIGTSGAVRTASSKPIFNFGAMTFNYRLDEHTFICGGAVNNGGMIIDWALKSLRNKKDISPDDYQELFKLIASKPPGSDGLLFLPYLSGERTPIWDAKSCGVFFGIKLMHEQAHFLRAAVEGICMALYHVLEAVEGTSGNVGQINVSGGFIDSPEWVQILADITGKRLVIYQTSDASAMGAIYMAMKEIGWITSYHELLKGQEQQVVNPDRHIHASYVPYFNIFKKLYLELKTSMSLLDKLQKDHQD